MTDRQGPQNDSAASRRRFLRLLAAAAGLPAAIGTAALLTRPTPTTPTPIGPAASAAAGTPLRELESARLVSGFRGTAERADEPGFAILDGLGNVLQTFSTAYRLHGFARDPNDADRLFAICRRPGTELLEVSAGAGTIERQIRSGPGHHFYGHAVLSADGGHLFTTENDYATGGHGRVVVRDAQTLAPIDALDSGGIGPHELARFGAGLVVANGGIQTHPDLPRRKLNLDSMRPNLAILDRDGRVNDRFEPPDHQMSVRHLAVTEAGLIATAQQYEGAPDRYPDLIGLASAAGDYDTLTAPRRVRRLMNRYIASVAASAKPARLLATCPRGNAILAFDADGIQAAQIIGARAPNGVATLPGGSIAAVTTLSGDLLLIDAARARVVHRASTPYIWDNHLLWI
ncbi:MAG: DUF1513 domain-containing protein [Pseudomonadota bacterium]